MGSCGFVYPGSKGCEYNSLYLSLEELLGSSCHDNAEFYLICPIFDSEFMVMSGSY